MASSPPLDRHRTRGRGQLPAAALSPVGASTAQAALARIIAIIAADPSPSPPRLPRPDAIRHGGRSSVDPEEVLGTAPPALEPRGLRIDLSLRLGPSTEIGGGSAEGDVPAPRSVVEDVCTAVGCDGGLRAAGNTSGTVPAAAVAGHSLSPAVSAAGGGAASTVAKSSQAECDSGGENRNSSDVKEKAFAEQEESKGSGGEGEAGTTTTTTISSSSTRRKGRAFGGEGCLDLLLEAVRQVSGGALDEDDDTLGAENLEPAVAEKEEEPPAPATGRTRRSAGGAARVKKRREAAECWIPFDLYEDETAPIVRSKRGRSQAMPSKYRDCVLDPWRKPPALTRHGRSARP